MNLERIVDAILDFDLAAKYYEKRVKEHSFSLPELEEFEHAIPYGFYHLGNTLYETNKYEEALISYEKTLKFQKEYPDVFIIGLI
ncbi:tetratricopeptide repeat protein [Campylobacter subantarcticus]|uniref:tetratricopeptide repeat protein n=1 Tax=Campylobacter subantarcticus TaxID=497724 RepID=UPI00370937EA